MIIILILALFLIGLGYFFLISIDPNITYERLIFEVRTAQISIIVGSFLLLLYLYRRL
ncbi:hypothetical protein [Thermodesulfobacterium sp. TA1]|uniref:hypothetical protein n=1 Tax=Thermodesulfobacterium sp. TA1 TaxID=2234087 RepID=UPI00143CCE5C|nr:hypothetical protein [Thermodesulfobacterium sp. TA1]